MKNQKSRRLISKRLFELYEREFGSEIMNTFPAIDHERRENTKSVTCNYIEYIAYIDVDNAEALFHKLSHCNFTEEQLDSNCFDTYRLKNAYVTFTVNKTDINTVRLCAKCPQPFLKRFLGISGVGGIDISKVIDEELAIKILAKQILKHTKLNIPEELSGIAIRQSIERTK